MPDRHICSYLDFMSHPTQEQDVIPPAKAVLGEFFTLVDTPEEADAAVCFRCSFQKIWRLWNDSRKMWHLIWNVMLWCFYKK